MSTKNLILKKETKRPLSSRTKRTGSISDPVKKDPKLISEVLFITTFPPRECGIATYAHDLNLSIQKCFGASFNISICALDSKDADHSYSKQIKFRLDTDDLASYRQLVMDIKADKNIKMIVLQHEFGLFGHHSAALIDMVQAIDLPISIVFHTVLPGPNTGLKAQVRALEAEVDSIIVMTESSSDILIKDYHIKKSKIHVIPHGTHLVRHGDKDILKKKIWLGWKRCLIYFWFFGLRKVY